jgi:hypothetical protein
MHRANFCAECGERRTFKGWRGLLRRGLCEHCARRLGGFAAYRPLILVALIGAAAFGFGRYLRPSPPPLIIQRAANSPLFEAPAQSTEVNIANSNRRSDSVTNPNQDDEVYICGARTKKGTPCRRRVHAAGERCFQHKGMPAMVALDKLVIKSANQPK